MASARGYLAFASWLRRDFDRAAQEASAALAMFRDLGDVEGAAWSLISLGTVARYQGEAERAAGLLAESRALAEGIGFREGIAWCCEQLSLLAAVDGDPGAITLLRRSLELHGELRDRWRMSAVLEDLAAIALALDRARPAARLLGAGRGHPGHDRHRDRPVRAGPAPADRGGVRAALGEEAFAAARQQGMLATADELTADLPSAEDPAPAPAGPGRGQAGEERDRPERAGPGEARRRLDGGPARDRRQAARQRAARAPARTDAAGPLRVRTLGGAMVGFGDAALTAADWGYAKPRELTLLAARRARPAEAALPELRRAIGAYGGDFLDGMSAGEWALVRRDELRRAFESALLAAGRLQAAAALFRRAVAHEPLNETAHRELMSCWARLGETARAVRHYEELTELLRDQVGSGGWRGPGPTVSRSG